MTVGRSAILGVLALGVLATAGFADSAWPWRGKADWQPQGTIRFSTVSDLPEVPSAALKAQCGGSGVACTQSFQSCPTEAHCEFVVYEAFNRTARKVEIDAASPTTVDRIAGWGRAIVQNPDALAWPALANAMESRKRQAGRLIAEASMPDWIEPLSATQLHGLISTRAHDLGQPGAVRLDCTVSAAGGLEKCEPTAVMPVDVDLGFGKAALAAQPLLHAKPDYRGSKPPAGSKVAIRLEFPAYVDLGA